MTANVTEQLSGDDATAEIARVRESTRASARAMLGITGRSDSPPLRTALAEAGVGYYPLGALGLLSMVDEFQQQAITVLGPEIAAALGISKSALAGALLVKTIAITLAVLPIAAWVQRRARRALLSVVTAFLWSILTITTGFVVSIWGLVLVMVADGATTGSVRAVHQPLLVDSYPPSVRVRVLSIYRAADSFGNILGPLVVGLCTVALGFTWRGVFLASGLVCLLAACVSVRLRDPGFGRWDDERVRAEVRARAGVSGDLDEGDVELGFFEIARRLLLIPTIRRVLGAWVALGVLLVPYTTYLAFFLQEEWSMGAGARSLFSAGLAVFSLVTLLIAGPRFERVFRRDPGRVLSVAGVLLAAAVVLIAVGVMMPTFGMMVAFLGLASALLVVPFPTMSMTMFAIIPSRMRPHLSAMAGIAAAAIGGGGGLLLLGGIERRFGTAGAILSLALPGAVGGLILRSASRTVAIDLDRMIDETVEEEEVRTLVGSGARLPMLSCRHVDFSYAGTQVLFGVDFTVEEGEIVALLGTNGAGKSTLLRVISGLGLPHRGSVRFRGVDITYVDAERRVRLGINQVPGGRAVFGPMTVLENLRVVGYSHGRDRQSIERGIEATFGAFPRLHERQGQLASTLSGGEQQMLALSSALMLRPRLLLIDELSLGLAPAVVGELLAMVRTINEAGTAIVLIEQSVNVALSVVEHAYFMEKGEIRFDGRSSDLIDRPDLLRSVFLEGVGRNLT